jgi:hypothetical protein
MGAVGVHHGGSRLEAAADNAGGVGVVKRRGRRFRSAAPAWHGAA